MGDFTTFHRSFSGGEVTQEFYGQIADNKFQTGLALCRNFMVMPHGPITNRAGTRFVREVKDSSKATLLIEFAFSFEQAVVIEFGHQYFRFHALGQTLLFPAASAWVTATAYGVGDLVTDSGTTYYCRTAHTSGATFVGDAANWYAQPASGVYEVPHTYTESQLRDVQYVQSGDVVTLVHSEHPVRELRRVGATEWELSSVTVGPTLAAPINLVGVATPGATPGTPFDTDYVVTALTTSGDESLRSATETVSNNLYDDGAYNTLTWDAVAGAVRYNVYKKSAGLFGFIGQTETASFKDDNIAPDTGATPPLDIDLFDSTSNYPRAVGYFDQRRVFASTITQPQNTWMTQAGTESNFNYSIPYQDKDSVQFKLASRGGDAIRHIVDMDDMILTTAAGIWRISGDASGVITPASVSARRQVAIGAGAARPVLAGNMLYAAAAGGHIREFGYSQDKNGYTSGDISVRAPHLFDGEEILKMQYALTPWPLVWAVSTSGALLGLTYVPEQGIGAWHQHTTQGEFEDIANIVENGDAVSYLIVNRTINGTTKRYIETMTPLRSRAYADPTAQYFVDCGVTYDTVIDGDGAPVTEVSGLDWLEGETVAILADGAECPQQEVVSGTVTLPAEASVIHIGLPFTADAQTLPLALEVAGYAQGMQKNLNQVFLRVSRSSGVMAGPDFDSLVMYKQRTTEPMGSAPDLKTGIADIVLTPDWTDDGALCIRQSSPLNMTVLSFALDVALSGG